MPGGDGTGPYGLGPPGCGGPCNGRGFRGGRGFRHGYGWGWRRGNRYPQRLDEEKELID